MTQGEKHVGCKELVRSRGIGSAWERAEGGAVELLVRRVVTSPHTHVITHNRQGHRLHLVEGRYAPRAPMFLRVVVTLI